MRENGGFARKAIPNPNAISSLAQQGTDPIHHRSTSRKAKNPAAWIHVYQDPIHHQEIRGDT